MRIVKVGLVSNDAHLLPVMISPTIRAVVQGPNLSSKGVRWYEAMRETGLMSRKMAAGGSCIKISVR